MRMLYRSFRNMVFRFIGETGARTKGQFLQEEEDDFPCDISNMRSPTIPTSVHRLKPGECFLFCFVFIVFLFCVKKRPEKHLAT